MFSFVFFTTEPHHPCLHRSEIARSQHKSYINVVCLPCWYNRPATGARRMITVATVNCEGKKEGGEKEGVMAGKLQPQPISDQHHNHHKQPTALTRLNKANSRSVPLSKLSTLAVSCTAAINGRTPNGCRDARKCGSKRSVVVSSTEQV
jgi:hypothetical protein